MIVTAESRVIVALSHLTKGLALSQVFADDHKDKQTNTNTNKDAKTQINPSI